MDCFVKCFSNLFKYTMRYSNFYFNTFGIPCLCTCFFGIFRRFFRWVFRCFFGVFSNLLWTIVHEVADGASRVTAIMGCTSLKKINCLKNADSAQIIRKVIRCLHSRNIHKWGCYRVGGGSTYAKTRSVSRVKWLFWCYKCWKGFKFDGISGADELFNLL